MVLRGQDGPGPRYSGGKRASNWPARWATLIGGLWRPPRACRSHEIGRAKCRTRVCKYGEIWVVTVTVTKKMIIIKYLFLYISIIYINIRIIINLIVILIHLNLSNY